MSLEYAFEFEGDGTPEDEDRLQKEALALWIEDAFRFSQDVCPVRTGTLKSSGIYDGVSIAYEAPYAEAVELGRTEGKHPFTGRFFVEQALNETIENFCNYLVMLLGTEFTVREA